MKGLLKEDKTANKITVLNNETPNNCIESFIEALLPSLWCHPRTEQHRGIEEDAHQEPGKQYQQRPV